MDELFIKNEIEKFHEKIIKDFGYNIELRFFNIISTHFRYDYRKTNSKDNEIGININQCIKLGWGGYSKNFPLLEVLNGYFHEFGHAMHYFDNREDFEKVVQFQDQVELLMKENMKNANRAQLSMIYRELPAERIAHENLEKLKNKYKKDIQKMTRLSKIYNFINNKKLYMKILPFLKIFKIV